MIGDASYDGLIAVSVSDSPRRHGSTCVGTLDISTFGATPAWLNPSFDRLPVSITFYDATRPSGRASFDGLCEQISFNATRQQVRFRARDYSAVLAASSAQSTYYNQTASQIVEDVALRHGFPCRAAPTQKIVGSYRNDLYNQLLAAGHSLYNNEWAFLSHLADAEGYFVYFDTDTLIFSSVELLGRSTWEIGADDVIDIAAHKACTPANGVRFITKSWNTELAETVSHTIEQTFDPSSSGDPTWIDRITTAPDLNPDSAERLNFQYLRSLKWRQSEVVIVMPGETEMRSLDGLLLSGTNSMFDSQYTILSIRRQFSAGAGFRQHIRAIPVQSDLDISPYSVGI